MTTWCVRPMLIFALRDEQDRQKLREGDNVICHCGKPGCRDADLYPYLSKEED